MLTIIIIVGPFWKMIDAGDKYFLRYYLKLPNYIKINSPALLQ